MFSHHHVVFFPICAKLTMAFTLTSLRAPLNLYTSVLDLKRNIGRLTDLTKQRHGLVDLRRLPLFTPLLKDSDDVRQCVACTSAEHHFIINNQECLHRAEI